MNLELKAELRKILGKKVSQLRQQGFVPAVVYGSQTKSIPLKVNLIELEKVYKQSGQSTMVKLKLDNEERNIIISEVKRNPVTDQIIHADFHQVRMDQETTAEVPLVFEGESEAVEVENGVLVKSITDLHVKALPADLPHEIKVDISVLKTFEDSIHVKDLNIPQGVHALIEPDEIVVSVTPPRQEEEEEVAPAEGEVETTEEGVTEEEKTGEKEPKEEDKTEEGKA